MKVGKWILGIFALVLLLGSTVSAQAVNANQLCIQNGGEYYINRAYMGFPNYGVGKYFPTYSHYPNTPKNPVDPVLVYPWKLMGWSWTGMQADLFSSVWYWETALQASKDNPRATTMSWDYPVLFCTGQVPHTSAPMPIYGGTLGTLVPVVNTNGWVYPSSAGGFDAYLNIFAVGGGSWLIPSTSPFYGVNFAFLGDCASAMTIPSSHSIWEFVWAEKGWFGGITQRQYMIMSGNEIDCLGGNGQKGRNYSITGDFDNGYLWWWSNTCDGQTVEWDMCLFVCDAVTVPVNVPGAPNGANPFSAYGFDVGSPTLLPYLTSGCMSLGFTTNDYNNPGDTRFVLAAFAASPGPLGPFKPGKYRLKHGWDLLTNLYVSLIPLFAHVMTPGFPGAQWGTTVGGASITLPFPPDPALQAAELIYTSLSATTLEPSASYLVTYF